MEEKNIARLYLILFNAITEAVSELEKSKAITPHIQKALVILKSTQQTTEEIYKKRKKAPF